MSCPPGTNLVVPDLSKPGNYTCTPTGGCYSQDNPELYYDPTTGQCMECGDALSKEECDRAIAGGSENSDEEEQVCLGDNWSVRTNATCLCQDGYIRMRYNQGTLRCAADPAASSGVDALGNAPPTAIAAAVVVLGLFLCCCGVMLWACFRPCCSSGRKSRRKRRKRQEGRKRKKEQESEGRGHGSKGTRRSKRRRRKREKRNARRTRHRSRGDQPKSARLRRGHVKGDRRRAYDPEQGRPRRTQRARGHDEGWDPRYPALPPSQPPPPGPHGRWGGEWVPAEAGRGAGELEAPPGPYGQFYPGYDDLAEVVQLDIQRGTQQGARHPLWAHLGREMGGAA